MDIIYRASDAFMADVRRDLVRAHPFAEERVGFISVKCAETNGGLLLLAENYFPVADSDYVYAPSVGAMMGQEAIRKALDIALLHSVGMIHVHMHLFPGRLWFSPVDLREQVKFIPDFFKVRRNMPHGAIVLSPFTCAGRVWLEPNRVERIDEFNTVGTRVRVSKSANDGSVDFYA